MAKITHEDKIFNVRTGQDLLKAYQINTDIPLKFGCCKGDCGACLIHVMEGYDNLSRMGRKEKETLEAKKIKAPFRLACQCAINGDITIQ